MLDAHGIGAHPVDDVETVHASIEAMKLAFADLHQYNADIDAMPVKPDALLNPDYLRSRAALIDTTRAGDPGYGAPRPGGTVYLAAADASGLMVSFIQSNYMGFGSGVVVPGTGISLQNRGHGFNLIRATPTRWRRASAPRTPSSRPLRCMPTARRRWRLA